MLSRVLLSLIDFHRESKILCHFSKAPTSVNVLFRLLPQNRQVAKWGSLTCSWENCAASFSEYLSPWIGSKILSYLMLIVKTCSHCVTRSAFSFNFRKHKDDYFLAPGCETLALLSEIFLGLWQGTRSYTSAALNSLNSRLAS